MQKSVIEYFDAYFGGQLNESTTDEQLEQAALDLVFLTEAVIEFYESVASAAKQHGHTTQMLKHLKRPFLGIPWNKKQRKRSNRRKDVSQTVAGTSQLAKIDQHQAGKNAQRDLDYEIEKNPSEVETDPDVVERERNAGKEIAKTDLIAHIKLGRQAKKHKIKAGGSPRGSAHRTFFGEPFGTVKVTDEEVKHYEKDEEEEGQRIAKKRKGRDVLPAGAEFVASKYRGELKRRKYEKDYEGAGTSGQQLSFMSDAGKLLTKAKRWTTKSGREVEAETKRASAEAGSIMDIIKKHHHLKRRYDYGGTPKEREARGQGKLF